MKNQGELFGKIALVTGGASGIGKAICEDLAKNGATIVIADINEKTALETAKELEETGTDVLAIKMDVSNKQSIEDGFAKALEKYKTIDILVNNAASPGSGVALPHLYSKPSSEWDDVFAIDLKGLVLCVKQVYHLMKENQSGKIINIASISGRMASPSVPEYGAVKAGVIQYTQTLAKDLAEFNVNVNAVCPGFLFTNMWKTMGEKIVENYPEDKRPTPYQVFKNMVESLTPLKREQEVEDIAYLVTFLATEKARNITGQAINVDGGTCMN